MLDLFTLLQACTRPLRGTDLQAYQYCIHRLDVTLWWLGVALWGRWLVILDRAQGYITFASCGFVFFQWDSGTPSCQTPPGGSAYSSLWCSGAPGQQQAGGGAQALGPAR